MLEATGTNNFAEGGDGGFLFSRGATPILLRDVVIDNCSTTKSGGGGGIAAYRTTVALERVSTRRCYAGKRGGGGLLFDGLAEGHLFECIMDDNTIASSSGGHINVAASSLIVHSKGTQIVWPKQEPVFPEEMTLQARKPTSMLNGVASVAGGSISCIASFSKEVFGLYATEIEGSACSSTLYQRSAISSCSSQVDVIGWEDNDGYTCADWATNCKEKKLHKECEECLFSDEIGWVDDYGSSCSLWSDDCKDSAILTECSDPPQQDDYGVECEVGGTYSEGAYYTKAEMDAVRENCKKSCFCAQPECEVGGFGPDSYGLWYTKSFMDEVRGNCMQSCNDCSGTVEYACPSKGIFLGTGTTLRHSAATEGGTIVGSFCAVEMSSISILNGTSTTGDGGAVLLGSGSTLWVNDNSTFENNTAEKGSGGAVSCQQCISMEFLGGTTFKSNVAFESGGAVKVTEPEDSMISTESLFIGNIAQTKNGGAVDSYHTIWNSVNDQFEYNVAESGSGGAFMAFGSPIKLKNHTFRLI